jgi:hypothetical protein
VQAGLPTRESLPGASLVKDAGSKALVRAQREATRLQPEVRKPRKVDDLGLRAMIGRKEHLYGYAAHVVRRRNVADAAASELPGVDLCELLGVVARHTRVVKQDQVVEIRVAVGAGEVR